MHAITRLEEPFVELCRSAKSCGSRQAAAICCVVKIFSLNLFTRNVAGRWYQWRFWQGDRPLVQYSDVGWDNILLPWIMAQFRSRNYLDLIKVLASTYRRKIKVRSGVEGIKKGIKSRAVESHIWAPWDSVTETELCLCLFFCCSPIGKVSFSSLMKVCFICLVSFVLLDAIG